MRLFTGIAAAGLLLASGAEAATFATGSVRSILSFTVQGGDPNDLDIAITPFETIAIDDIAGAVSIDSDVATADEFSLQTEVDLGASAGPAGGLIDLRGFADFSVTLTNTGTTPFDVLFSVEYFLDASASVAQPLLDTAFGFASIDVSSTVQDIVLFASLDTLVGSMPPTLSDVYAPLAFTLDAGAFEVIDVLTEAQVIIDAAPIPLPPAGMMLVAALGGLAGIGSLRRKRDAEGPV